MSASENGGDKVHMGFTSQEIDKGKIMKPMRCCNKLPSNEYWLGQLYRNRHNTPKRLKNTVIDWGPRKSCRVLQYYPKKTRGLPGADLRCDSQAPCTSCFCSRESWGRATRQHYDWSRTTHPDHGSHLQPLPRVAQLHEVGL